jgi:hypothetical protein
MQDSSLCFTFTDLPRGTTAALLRNYLSIFGEVASLDFDPAKGVASVIFSSSSHPERILAVQHKFMGTPICVAPVLFSVSSPPSQSNSPRSCLSPNFRYMFILCAVLHLNSICFAVSQPVAAAFTHLTMTCLSWSSLLQHPPPNF